jgi:hypothetical protein
MVRGGPVAIVSDRIEPLSMTDQQHQQGILR